MTDIRRLINNSSVRADVRVTANNLTQGHSRSYDLGEWEAGTDDQRAVILADTCQRLLRDIRDREEGECLPTRSRPRPPYAILVSVPRETGYLATPDEHAAVAMQCVIRDALRRAGYEHPVVAIVNTEEGPA